MSDVPRSKALKLKKTEMDSLPLEVKFNIFSRNPVKTLGICIRVCKEWQRIMSDPSFRKLHLDHAKRNRQLLLMDQSRGINYRHNLPQLVKISSMSMDGEVNYRFLDMAKGYIDMLPSGHGLVCLVDNNLFYIFNPSTKQCLALPEAAPSSNDELNAGFGYLPLKNEYKLVHLVDQYLDNFDYEIKCEILTLSDGGGTSSRSWRQIERKCPYIVNGRGVLVNNVFYWMIWHRCSYPKNEPLLSLDLEKEDFETVPHPHITSRREGNNNMHLMELRSCLCLVDTFAYLHVTDIWCLKDQENKLWEKLYRIDLTSLEGFNDVLMAKITPLDYQNGEIVVFSGHESLNFYNVKSKRFRRGKDLDLRWDIMICPFTDSFFSFGNGG